MWEGLELAFPEPRKIILKISRRGRFRSPFSNFRRCMSLDLSLNKRLEGVNSASREGHFIRVGCRMKLRSGKGGREDKDSKNQVSNRG